MPARVLRYAVLALVGALVLLGLYGVLVEPRLVLDEERHTVAIPGLTQAQEGTEVAVFSDIQVGMWWTNTGMVKRVVERVVEADPDVVLLPGDFLYGPSEEIDAQIDTVLELLAPLTDGGMPTIAVLGNHDHQAGAAEQLAAALEGSGIQVLRNEAVALPAGGSGQPLHVVGIGPEGIGLADPQRAFEGIPADAPRIVLTHYPSVFPQLAPGVAPLTVAGHTHCGQIAVPGSPIWRLMGLTDEEKDAARGWAPADYGATGNRMFVTCGIGFSIVPARINAPPQLVFFELTAG